MLWCSGKVYLSSTGSATVNGIPDDWSRQQIAVAVLGIGFVLLFVPTSTSGTALVELLVGDVPAEALFSIALVAATLVGIVYLVSNHRPGGSNGQK